MSRPNSYGLMERSAFTLEMKGGPFAMFSVLSRRVFRGALRFSCHASAAAVVTTLLTEPARALGPVDTAIGYQYYSGAVNQTTWSPKLELESDFTAWSVSLAASHFDDNQSGSAWGVTGGVKFPLSTRAKLSLAGTGFAGDSVSGAWRLKAGPEFSLAIKDQTLGIFYAHYDDALGVASNALCAEFDTPLTPQLSGNASLSLQNSDGTTGEDASVGLSWKPVGPLELSGDLGLSKNAGGLTGLLPSRRALRIVRGNKGRKGAAVTLPVTATLLFGVQAHF